MFKLTHFKAAFQKIILVSVILLLFKNSTGQSKYGFMAGSGNTSLYRFPFEVEDYNKYSSRISFWGGLTADFPISKNGINLFTTAAYSRKGYEYSIQKQNGATNTVKDSGYTQSLNYIDINLVLLKKFSMGDASSFFAGTGPSANLFISGNEQTSLTYFGNTMPPVKNTETNLSVGNGAGTYKRISFSLGLVMGFELNKFKLWLNYNLPLTSYYQDENKAAPHKLKAFGINVGYTLYTHNKSERIKKERPAIPDKVVKDTLTDTDGDGIPDKDDKCPGHKGVAKYKGCPIPDTDGDGVNDEEDKCPLVAGTAANNGCPEFADTVKPAHKDTTCFTIYFEPAKSDLRTEAYNKLSEVIKLLKANSKLVVVFKGHTDNVGSVAANNKRSLERAVVCADYVASFYIDRNRISTEAYGNTRPAADLKDPLVQWRNRRVEICVFEKNE